jgi:hypothetical protein
MEKIYGGKKPMLSTIASYLNQVIRGGKIRLNGKTAQWKKVSQLKVGEKIAVPAELKANAGIEWDEIVAVRKLGRERVWDIEIEGTHNFVGNGILAHNTYIMSGNVGIGSTSPLTRIHISDSQAATASAWIENLAAMGTANHTGLVIKLGSLGVGDTATSNDRFINFMKGDSTIIGKIQGNGDAVNYATEGTDFAEYFTKTPGEEYEEGDVISISTGERVIAKSNSSYDNRVLGVISQRSGFTGGQEGPDKIAVGLVGQIPVKISTMSSAIKEGDPLTTSAEIGKAMKLEHAGMMVARALEGWTPAAGKKVILAYVATGWLDPTTGAGSTAPLLSPANEIAVAADATIAGTLQVGGKSTLADVAVTGKITNGLLVADGLNGELHTLAESLRLQQDGLNGIQLVANKIEIDTQGNVNIKQGVIFGNPKMRDAVNVAAGQSEVVVAPTGGWDKLPVTIVVTPSYETLVWVENVTKDGFAIKLGTAAVKEEKVYWSAIW